MANSTIPNLVAVSVPAGTDLLGVRQSGDTRDKKLTVTQLLSLAPGGGDVTKVGTPVNDQLAVWTGDGTLEGNANFNVVSNAFQSTLGNGPSILNVSSTSGTVPSLVPRQGDPNTGVSNAGDDRIALTAGGVMAIRAIEAGAVISSIDLFGPTIVTGLIQVTDAAGPAMLNEAASATNPTLNPNRADADSGVGQNAVDQVSIIGGGVELARFVEAVGIEQALILNNDNTGLPDLGSLGDPDTGWHWTTANAMAWIGGGSRSWNLSTGLFFSQFSDGPAMVNVAAGLATPTLLPDRADSNTGVGGNGSDILTLIAGGVEQLRVSATAAASFQAGTAAAGNGGDLDLDAGPSGVAATGDGGSVNVAAGASLATNGSGGAINIDGGAGVGSGAGGDVILQVGASGAAGPGTSGSFFVNTTTGLTASAGIQVAVPALSSIFGVGRSGEGVAGALELWGGYAAGTGGASRGGDLNLFGGGQGGGAGTGGDANLYGGESDTQPGAAEVEGGTATVGGVGGQARVLGGPGFGVNFGGGLVRVQGGAGVGTGNGGQANLRGGTSGSGATGNGGAVDIVGGLAASTVGDGGDINLIGGTESGAGTPGIISLSADGAAVTWDGDSLLLPQVNDAVTPTLAFGDGNTGFYESADNNLRVSIGGTNQWQFIGTAFIGANAAGPDMENNAPGATAPNIHCRTSDQDTGFGSSGLDALSFISGGVEGLRLTELNAGVLQTPSAIVGITANPGGGQVSATQLNNTNSVIATAATTGDSVKLPPVFIINTIIFVKNDGANAADVFPASGDNLGAGVDTAISLASGESASFIATVANNTWTPWIVSVGGGGDVTKVGTPANDQVGVWTGDGTIEGTAALTLDTAALNTTLRFRSAFGSSGAPAHSFTGETNSGLFRQSAGVIMMSIAGTGSWVFRGTSFDSNIADGPRLMFEAASATNPTLIPRLADTDSGIGSGAADQVDLIAGGLSCISVRETAAARQVGFYVTAPISLQTGVAVSAAGIHAALVALGLITA